MHTPRTNLTPPAGPPWKAGHPAREFTRTLQPKPPEHELPQKAVRVANPQGLHMRPAAAFAQLARSFRADVFVTAGQQRVDGKSLWDLLLLAAEAGTELVVQAAGPDAPRAVDELTELIASGR